MTVPDSGSLRGANLRRSIQVVYGSGPISLTIARQLKARTFFARSKECSPA
jgi:hypothetical protein